MRKILSIIAATAVCAAASSCSFSDLGSVFRGEEQATQQPEQTEQVTQMTEAAEVSNDITVGVMDLDVFDPLKTKSPTVDNACSFIFESLYTIDQSMKPVAELAQSSSLSADGLTYTVNLKQGVLWHDGKEFTASDVASSINGMKSSENNYSRYVAQIESVNSTDSYSVEIRFSRPVAEPDALMVFPLVRGKTEGEGDKAFFVPIGTGPFKMVSEKAADKYRLEAYEQYHGGRASLDAVNIIQVDSVDKFRTLFYANEIDIATTDVIDMSTYMPRSNAKINDTVTNRMIYIGFNTEYQALSDNRTRRAISCMINRDDIVTHYLYSRGVSADYALNPSSWLYFDTRKHLKSDNSEAEILLEQAGWEHDSNDSLYNTFDGKMMLYFTPEILVNSESEERVKIAEDLCDKLSSFGIRASVSKVDYATYQSRILAGNYDMFIGETELLANCDISDMTKSGENYFKFANEEVDLLLAQMGTVTTDEEKKAVAIELYEKIREQSPFAPICFKKESLITGSKLKQTVMPCAVDLINDTEQWRVR